MGHSDRCGICHRRGSRRVLVATDLLGKVPLPTGTIVCDSCQTRVLPPQRASTDASKQVPHR